MRTLLDVPERELGALWHLWKCGVAYLLTGGHAMRFHGVDRVANDVDVVVCPKGDNAVRLFDAIERIIGHAPHFSADVLALPKARVDFRADGLNLDVLTKLPGVDFGVAFAARESAKRAGPLRTIADREAWRSKSV